MNILGVAFLSDASAAVVRDGKLVSAVSEERLNRIKQWNGIPCKAIDVALGLAGLSIDDIDLIATHGAAPVEPDRIPFAEAEQRILAAPLEASVRKKQLEKLWLRYEHEKNILGKRTPDYLAQVKALGRPVEVYGHHEAHAACAYFGSGWDDCIVLTADGWGEDGSSTVWSCKDGRMGLKTANHTFDSLGYFYGSVTKALGFIPHRHEGKVLGLAAFCRNPKSYDRISKMISYDNVSGRIISRMENGLYAPSFDNPELDEYVRGFEREDVAAAAQNTIEEIVCELVRNLGGSDLRIALAGGIYANVKLNQRICQMPNVRKIFVFPNMGDGGLSVGAAWLACSRKEQRRPDPLKTVLLGNTVAEKEISCALAASGADYEHLPDMETRIAEILAQSNVVAHFDQRMEFGPRALGNRSLLYKATNPKVNTWLNDRLSRSEFMPFAPATLAEYADECYLGLDKARGPAKYMAVTFDCTDKMKAQSPAAVHVDGTARPQIISEEDYPRFHRILKAYHAITGIPSLINTSFNMHEEPIVSTVEDALRAFYAADLPYLALGNFLVRGKTMPIG